MWLFCSEEFRLRYSVGLSIKSSMKSRMRAVDFG